MFVLRGWGKDVVTQFMNIGLDFFEIRLKYWPICEYRIGILLSMVLVKLKFGKLVKFENI